MSYLTIGSGDVGKLLSGKTTKGYAELWRKFLDENPPYYNAYASPIDALRTGAIIEDAYYSLLPESYFIQVKSTFKEMDVFTCSLDFAKYEGGEIVDFEETKTIFFTDYIKIIKTIDVNGIKSKFKNNYNQVQFQLMCTGLDSANLVFISVDSYEDEENENRLINPNEITKFRIERDEDVISEIIERGKIFQQVKDHFK